MPRYSMLGHFISDYFTLYQVMSSYVRIVQVKSG